jgi:hypothetical protein
MALEKGSSHKNPEQGDLFTGESLAKYCDPRSPEFAERLADVVLSRIEYAKKNNKPYQSTFFVVNQLLTELHLQDTFNVSDVSSDISKRIEQRKIDAGQAEMREMNSEKIRAEAEKRWPEEGKPDEDIPYWIKY